MKGSGKPDDRKGQVRFEVAGAGDGFTVKLVRHRQTKETEQIGSTYGIPRQSSTLQFYFLFVRTKGVRSFTLTLVKLPRSVSLNV